MMPLNVNAETITWRKCNNGLRIASQAAAGELLGLDWRPSRFRERQSHDVEPVTGSLQDLPGSWGARASGLSHLTYDWNNQIS